MNKIRLILTLALALFAVVPAASHAGIVERGRFIDVENHRGGNVLQMVQLRERLGRSGKTVRIQGYCRSACTILTTLPNACLAPKSRIGFHAPRIPNTQIIPPLVFLGGAFYSSDMLPPFWEGVAKLNPVLYLVSGFRWSFFGLADVPVGVSLVAVGLMIAICCLAIRRIFATGWRLRE